MNADLQQIVALGIVVLAVIGLVIRWGLRRKHPGCSGSCTCPAEKLRR